MYVKATNSIHTNHIYTNIENLFNSNWQYDIDRRRLSVEQLLNNPVSEFQVSQNGKIDEDNKLKQRPAIRKNLNI